MGNAAPQQKHIAVERVQGILVILNFELKIGRLQVGSYILQVLDWQLVTFSGYNFAAYFFTSPSGDQGVSPHNKCHPEPQDFLWVMMTKQTG